MSLIFLCLQCTECEERGAAVPHVRRASPRAPHLTLRGSALTPSTPPLSSHQAIQVTTHIQYFLFHANELGSFLKLLTTGITCNDMNTQNFNKKCFDSLKTLESVIFLLV